jgi:hypothetical protein
MVPRWVIIVEGATQAAIDHVLSTSLGPSVLRELGVPEVLHGTYCLQHDRIAAA